MGFVEVEQLVPNIIDVGLVIIELVRVWEIPLVDNSIGVVGCC